MLKQLASKLYSLYMNNSPSVLFSDINSWRNLRYTFGAIYYFVMRYVPSGREKEFISYRYRTKWDYIEFAKQIYRTSESEYIAKTTCIYYVRESQKKASTLSVLFSMKFAYGKWNSFAMKYTSCMKYCFAIWKGKFYFTFFCKKNIS